MSVISYRLNQTSPYLLKVTFLFVTRCPLLLVIVHLFCDDMYIIQESFITENVECWYLIKYNVFVNMPWVYSYHVVVCLIGIIFINTQMLIHSRMVFIYSTSFIIKFTTELETTCCIDIYIFWTITCCGILLSWIFTLFVLLFLFSFNTFFHFSQLGLMCPYSP